MLRRVSAGIVTVVLLLMSATPSFAATEYVCSASATVTRNGQIISSTTSTFEAMSNLSRQFSQSYSAFGQTYTLSIQVSCKPGT